MCELDFDGHCEVFQETDVVARKEHTCDCCCGRILPGQKYTRHFSKFDGEITAEKICWDCDCDRLDFANAHGGTRPTPGYTQELIHDCLHQREDFKQMLRWARMLKRMRQRRAVKS